MKTKKSKTTENPAVDVNALPEIEQQASLNLNLTKDDLVDILVDQQLTKLETQVKITEEQLEIISKQIEEHKAKAYLQADKIILSRLPKEIQNLVTKNNYKLSYYQGYNETSIDVENSEGGDVIKVFKINTKTGVEKLFNTPKALIDRQDELVIILKNTQEQIQKLEKSPRRLKAKLLTEFLDSSESGKNILNMIKQQEVKLLA